MSNPAAILFAALLLAAACANGSAESPSPNAPAAGAQAEPAATPPAAPAAAIPPGSAAEPPSEPLSCDERMDRFAARLAPAAKEGNWLPIPAEIEPIESPRGEPVQWGGAVVVLTRDGAITLDGEPVAEAELGEQLAAWRRMREQMAATSRAMAAVYVWADRAADPAKVARIAAAAPAALPARLVVVGAQHVADDYEKALLGHATVAGFRDQLATADEPSNRAVMVAEHISNAVGLCAPLIRVFGNTAGIEASSKGEYLAKGAPSALRECDCGVADLDLLEYALLAVMGAFERPVRTVPIAEAADLLAR